MQDFRDGLAPEMYKTEAQYNTVNRFTLVKFWGSGVSNFFSVANIKELC